MKVYACHNKPRSLGYWARQLVFGDCLELPPEEGWVWIEDSMSQDCRYDKQQEDARCADCERINALDYSPK